MKRIDNATAVDERFTEGDPVAGTPATQVPAWWLNQLQEELVKVITDAGLSLDGEDLTQLAQAIGARVPEARAINTSGALTGGGDLSDDRTITVRGATTAQDGVVQLATTAEAEPGTNTTHALTPEGAAAYVLNLFTSNRSASYNGYQTLPGGLILQWGQVSTDASGTTVALPVTFPTAALNAQATDLSDQGGTTLACSAKANITHITVTAESTCSAFWFAVGY